MREKQNPKVPKPYPKWKNERSINEYLAANFPKPPNMTDEEHVLSLFPFDEDEHYEDWLLRLGKQPILAFLLSSIRPFECEMDDPYWALAGRILMPVSNMHGLLNWADVIGQFGDLRIQSLKNIGYLFDQNEERPGRYGRPMAVKCATHYGLRKMGIDSRLILNLKGNSFFHSNTATPRPDLVKDSQHTFYREHSLGPWPLMVTSHIVNKVFIACNDSQFGEVRIPRDATQEWLDKCMYFFKWQHYKGLLYNSFDQDNRLEFRACTNPKFMFDRGLVDREVEAYEWGYKEDRRLDESGRNVTYMKLVEMPLPKPRIIREYLAHLDEQTWAPIHLLNKLKGFDPSKIRPDK